MSTTDAVSRSERIRAATLSAAAEVFLRDGFTAAGMDEIASRAHASKQTVYKHFGSKDALFIELVTTLTQGVGEGIHAEPLDAETSSELASLLEQRLDAQLAAVLEPRVLRLRRLVIGEASRFPELAEALWEHGPRRAIDKLAEHLAALDERGLLRVPEPRVAAIQLNWLVMGAPLNDAMLRGDAAVPGPAARKRHVRAAVATFLAAHQPG